MKKINPILVALSCLVICVVTAVNGADESNQDAKSAKNADHVYWLITTSIKEGEFDHLKTLNAELVKANKAKEPGTLSYDWSVSDDKKNLLLL